MEFNSQHSQNSQSLFPTSERLSQNSSSSPFQFLSPFPSSSSTFGLASSSRASSQPRRVRVRNSIVQSLQNEVKTQKRQAQSMIEAVIKSIIDSVSEGRVPVLEHSRLVKSSKDLKKVQENPELKSRIVFRKQSSRTFALLVFVMSLIHRMLQQNQTSTLRDLYYESMTFFGNQTRLSNAIQKLTFLLKVPREALCVEASVKGLVAGSISFRNLNGDTMRASDFRHGLTIPNKLHELTIITDAKYILFVEKDATFQRLLDENLFSSLGSIILITGKGYPDMQTRRLMCILNRVHKLKVYAMVDCDPYGIEIAAIVKWGSYANANVGFRSENHYLTNDLSIPDLVWLGLLPSEQTSLALTMNASADLTERDKKKIEAVRQRILIQNHEPWLEEINQLERIGRKTELEALFASLMFTSSVYLPSKLNSLHPPSHSNSSGSIRFA